MLWVYIRSVTTETDQFSQLLLSPPKLKRELFNEKNNIFVDLIKSHLCSQTTGSHTRASFQQRDTSFSSSHFKYGLHNRSDSDALTGLAFSL